jgi:hypothetical protein
MSESKKPDKDIEILKVTLLSDFRNGSFFAWLTIFLAAILGFLIMWWQYEAGMNALYSVAFYSGGAFIVGSLTVIFVFLIARPYLKHLERLNDLIKQIEREKRLRDFIDLVNNK